MDELPLGFVLMLEEELVQASLALPLLIFVRVTLDVVVEPVVVHSHTLSFLQEANEIATAAIANNVIFFIVFSLNLRPKV